MGIESAMLPAGHEMHNETDFEIDLIRSKYLCSS